MIDKFIDVSKDGNEEKNKTFIPPESGNSIVLFQAEDGNVSLDVSINMETVWLSRAQIADLYERDIKTIGKHINNALKEELDFSVVAKFATTAADGNKRIAAAIFLYFLEKNGMLYRDGSKVIADHTLVAITVMIAESKPEEKDTMVKLVMNFLTP